MRRTSSDQVPKHKKFLKTFGKIDRFATTPSFNYRGDQHYSFVGVTLSALIYAFLLGYLVYKLNEAFNDPEISSYTLVGQLQDQLDFNETVICIDDGTTIFNQNYDINTVFYVKYRPELSLQRVYADSRLTGICGSFNGDASINTNENIVIGVTHSRFSENSINYTIYYQYIAFDADKIEVPRIISPKSYVQSKTNPQRFLLNFEKAKYKINRSPLQVYSENYDCPIFSTVEPNAVTGTDEFIRLRYTARKTVYTIKCLTIPSVLSAVVGLLETITAIIVLFLARFFELKYYENLANSFKPPSQKLKAGFFAFIGMGKKDSNNKAISDEIKKEKEFIDSKLDIMTYLNSHIKDRDIELYKQASSCDNSPQLHNN